MSKILSYILFCFVGAIGGVFGGMGMGGGTLLIPALTFLFSVEQKLAQSLNLLAFLPMSIVALIIHIKNKRVDFKNSLFMIIPALIFSIGFSLLSSILKSKFLKSAFGYFLILLSLLTAFLTYKENKNTENS